MIVHGRPPSASGVSAAQQTVSQHTAGSTIKPSSILFPYNDLHAGCQVDHCMLQADTQKLTAAHGMQLPRIEARHLMHTRQSPIHTLLLAGQFIGSIQSACKPDACALTRADSMPLMSMVGMPAACSRSMAAVTSERSRTPADHRMLAFAPAEYLSTASTQQQTRGQQSVTGTRQCVIIIMLRQCVMCSERKSITLTSARSSALIRNSC